MEEKLNEINWSSLGHAYGSAENVPELIMDLKSQDSEIRNNAYHELFGNIWHQGTVYSATAYAVPFLFEILDSPATQDKNMLICLLAGIASGSGYYQVHQPIFEKWHSNVSRHEDEIIQEESNVNAVRKAISPRFEALLEYLTGEDSEVRLSIAEAAAYYPEHSEKSISALKELLKTETDEEVIEAIEESLNQLVDDQQ